MQPIKAYLIVLMHLNRSELRVKFGNAWEFLINISPLLINVNVWPVCGSWTRRQRIRSFL